ncbi:MAG: 4-hydroxy-tetrahydrodipicolinate synthase [Flavobacteriales bacterium]|nr:4-hydroxy-tetrahydrodipicolinate synthase [Flavobacteriales bacterium]
MEKYRGTGVAMITPFTDNLEVDFEALKKLTEHLVSNGINYLVVMGTTGENPTISDFEQQRILETVQTTNENRIPVVFGIAGNNTKSVVERMKSFDYTGVSAILSASPYYNKPNQAGLVDHYTQLADASKAPIILYNVPGRTGSMMALDTILKLAEHPNIIAIKEASGNLDHCMKLIRQKPAEFLVISGDDNFTLPYIAAGMVGVISVIGNAYPKEFSQMVRYALENNFENARYLHYRLLPLMNAIFDDGNPGGIKAVLKNMGICNDFMRAPLHPVLPEVEDKLKTLMAKYKA